MSKKKTLVLWIGLLCLVGLVLIVFEIKHKGQTTQVGSVLETQAAPQSIEGFNRASGPIPLNFPADHGPHPDYQTEWWYFTGNLEAADGRHFGYQLTFFRRALAPPNETTPRPSEWATNQAYLAHFALTDVSDERYQAFERLERGAASLAGAQAEPFQVWLDDWKVMETQPGLYQIEAAEGVIQLKLNLTDRKGPILQGDQGYSQKGPDPGNASYYVSLPRLETKGFVQIAAEQYQVEGLSWMDHEWSTSALSTNQVGWDWFSIQLDDGSDLMLFQIRRADGSIDPFSSGALIAPDGRIQSLTKDDFQIIPLKTWTSPTSQAVYPAGWRLKIPTIGANLELEPYLADQELNGSYSYWEGAVRAQGELNGQVVSGSGYVEMTGYAGSMGGEF